MNKSSLVNTVCIILGPYRNVTTLTASCCMLHPEIQVLNHGFSINKSDKTNFLLSYSDKKFDNFIFEVLEIARKGQSIPREGGVVTASHAFMDYEIMRKTFYERYKNTHKENVRSIVWKDSQHNTNILMPSDFDDLLSKNHKLRFLLPIRNPMDCAVSNARSRKQLFGEDVETTEDVLEGIFKIYSWFFKFEDKYPLQDYVYFHNNHRDYSSRCLLLP